MHNLINRDDYINKKYGDRIYPVQFSESITAAITEDNTEIIQDAKSWAGNALVQLIQDGLLRFSEFDTEGISELQRLSKQKLMSGRDRFFIMSEKGTGPSTNDHIFAAYVCFMIAIREPVTIVQQSKRLGKSSGSFTKR